jgi:hypothetical protein
MQDRERAAETYLLPPPRLMPSAELPPQFGALELAPFTGDLPDEIEPFEASAPDDDVLSLDQARSIAARIQKHEVFQKRLARTRWSLVGVARRGERGKGEPIRHMLVAYDYGNDVAVEFTMNEGNDRLLEVSEAAYQPPVTPAEVEQAFDLARADRRLAEVDLDDLVQMSIPLDSDVTGERANHRMLEVLFGCRGERAPRYRAVVDLSTQQVISAAGPEGCGHPRPEGSQS